LFNTNQLSTLHQDSTSEGYGSCHDPDSAKETTPDPGEAPFWSRRIQQDDVGCASSVSSQDSGMDGKRLASETPEPAFPGGNGGGGPHQSMDHVIDLFEDLEEQAGVVEGVYDAVVGKKSKKRWSTETCGSEVIVKTPSNSPPEVTVSRIASHILLYFYNLYSKTAKQLSRSRMIVFWSQITIDYRCDHVTISNHDFVFQQRNLV
jgi:hypothetical protein